MKQEVYVTDFNGLLRLVGFGPALGNNHKPPLVAILDTGEVLTCDYYTGDRVGNQADIFFPERNYILGEEFEFLYIHNHLKRLLEHGRELIMDLGEGWEDERSFAWNLRNPSYLEENGISIENALRINESLDIIRAKQVYDELVLVHSLPLNRFNNIPAPKDARDLKTEITRLFWDETSRVRVNPGTPKTPGLDGPDYNGLE